MLLLGPAWGLLVERADLPAVQHLPVARPVHAATRHDAIGAATRSFGFVDVWDVFATARTEPRIMTMIVLAGVSSFFVGNAFQAQMPEYAQYLGADDTGAWYSDSARGERCGRRPRRRCCSRARTCCSRALAPRSSAPACGRWRWACFRCAELRDGRRAARRGRRVQHRVYVDRADAWCRFWRRRRVRGSIVGLFNTAILGLRAGRGLTVGVVGAVYRRPSVSRVVVAGGAACDHRAVRA